MDGNEERRIRTIATFYSFKGGTGRTMALANIAFLLGRELRKTGERVLAVDWDLEAPGLHLYFPLSASADQAEVGGRPGLIDYFRDLLALLEQDAGAYGRLVNQPGVQLLEEVLPLSRYVAAEVADGLDLMLAGRFDAGYQDRVASFDWAGFHRKYHRLFRKIQEQITARYSWCLIDSRTGLTDVSGVCTMLMPEKLIGVFTPNRQSVEGLLGLVKKAIAYRRESDDPRPLSVFPLPSRLIAGELELSREARADYRKKFERCLQEAYGVEAVDLKPYFDEVEIPHKDYYGFGERVAVRDDASSTDALSINQAYQRFYDRLVRGDAAWEIPAAYTDVPEVYIASTSQDLGPYRTAVRDAALAAGLLPVMMEDLVAEGSQAASEALSKVSDAALVVVIVAHRYGWVPPDQDKSTIWLECEQAIQQGKEVLSFLVDEHCPWPPESREAYRVTEALESGNLRHELLEEVQRRIKGLQDFRNWLREHLITSGFTTPEDLGVQAAQAFLGWRERHPELGTPIGGSGRTDPSRYLDLLRQQTRWIDIRGIQVGEGKAHRFPIDDLYIPLTATSGEPPAELGGPKSGSVPLEQLLDYRKLVIVGDPGSGKTTFLRNLVFQLCNAEFRGAAAESQVLKPGWFPMLIRLPVFASHIQHQLRVGKGSETTRAAPGWIAQFLAAESGELNTGLDEEFFRRKLSDGRCLVLLDELDAVANRVERESLASLVGEAAETYPECRFVVTTRPQSYTGTTRLAGFHEVRVDELQADAIAAFLGHWSRCLFPGDEQGAVQHHAALSEALHARAAIRRMARNPVMLTALAVVHWNERRLPEQRADLYNSIAVWLARARDTRPGREQADRVLSLLGHLALGMQTQPKGRITQVDKAAAAEIIAPQFREAGNADERLARARAFLEAEEVDSGIFVSRGAELRFWHLTLQEFLAAQTIAGLTDSSQHKLLFEPIASKQARLYQSEWREVMLLLGGTLIGQGSGRVDGLFGAMLDRVGSKATLAEKARCAGLIGAMLRDLRPHSYNLPDRRFEQMLQEVLGIFDREQSRGIDLKVRLAAVEALGQAGDPRLRLPKDEDYWVSIPAGKFIMGDSEEGDTPEHEVDLDAFLIGRYPVTVYEYGRFLEDAEYKAPGDWEEQSTHPNRPVVNVTWFDAEAYCQWARVRLPTEAEWERAARGADGRRYAWGGESPSPELANYDEAKIGAASPVGLFPRGSTPAPEAIADLTGNVWEWVADWYDAEYYGEPQDKNPKGPETGKYKGLRGGSWVHGSTYLRAAVRGRGQPEVRYGGLGFRCVREVFP